MNSNELSMNLPQEEEIEKQNDVVDKQEGEKLNKSTELAFSRTKMANQRTYLAYMRTSIVISGASAVFKQYWLVAFGIFMLLLSSAQYLVINQSLDNNTKPGFFWDDYTPLLYVVFVVIALFMQLRNNLYKDKMLKKIIGNKHFKLFRDSK
tara:strand:- start:686 stop:1138 length:453 start_codon:yes stop_codon:yes gene_type:complete